MTAEDREPGEIESSTKDRSSEISPRSVLFLPPEKLYRKQAFDRRNQRECRAKKKLLSQALEEENASLRSKLEGLEAELARRPKELHQGASSSPFLAIKNQDPRIWQVLPLSVPPMCRLDHVMHHLVSSGRQPDFLQAAIEEIAQSTFPRVVSLLNPAAAEVAPVASTIGEHGPWMQITSSAARIAVMSRLTLRLAFTTDEGAGDVRHLPIPPGKPPRLDIPPKTVFCPR